MANAEMKIFEAERLHQPMIAAVSIIPIIPLKWTRKKQKVSFDYFHSYLYKSSIYPVLLNVPVLVKLLSNIPVA